MCFHKLLYLPYVSTLLLLCTCIISISAQVYPQSRHFNIGQRFVPGPVYQDPGDYNDANQYPDYVAPVQSEPVDNNAWSIAHQPQVNLDAAIISLKYTPTWVPGWPSPLVKLGQVSAVALDGAGNVVVFHRATRTWDRSTFTKDNRYWNTQEPPIAEPTVAVINSTSGQLIDQWGENLFYLPHGLTVDSQNNIWVTDVALHQVMKFLPNKKDAPVLTLGIRQVDMGTVAPGTIYWMINTSAMGDLQWFATFGDLAGVPDSGGPFTPGNSNYNFCKPSGVAVMESGEFFVSDGYCNTRIIKYSADGRKLLQWGRNTFHGAAQVVAQRYSFAVPHALALAEDKGLLCVADRENGRVQCFNSNNGTFVSQFHSPIIGSRLFSVAYSSVNGGQLYVVNGPEYTPRPIRGFVIDINTKKILSEFGPNNKDFSNPHDIAVSRDGREVYVVELDPFKCHKFVDQTIPPEALKSEDKGTSDPKVDVTAGNNSMAVISSVAPAKPTATVEGLSLTGGGWAGWAGVAGGVAGGLGAVLLLLLGGAALLARAKHHRGCLSPLTPRNRRQRWDYAPGAPDFKLRHLLERPRGAGFERINTEESDEEPTPATSMLAPQNA